MDEVGSNSHSKFRLFGFWKRYRARQDQKYVEALSGPGDYLHPVEEIREAENEYRMHCIKSGRSSLSSSSDHRP